MAHIGVLNEFQSANIPLDFIVGTSAGALYGVNFAFGYTYDKLLEMFNREINKPKLLTLMSHFSFSFSGLAKISHLKKLIHIYFH